ncbi:hypothetical protein NDU88_004581 [Pleurodeles waltl]|uniref:Uncharacterized protein n=1 Tax=Pleurodeles waltl TaxID=8319 RepID=A0AAV7W728_PLEWA|nr:hypothetical protein NDU88_004581 [Pleurodeles waltl]
MGEDEGAMAAKAVGGGGLSIKDQGACALPSALFPVTMGALQPQYLCLWLFRWWITPLRSSGLSLLQSRYGPTYVPPRVSALGPGSPVEKGGSRGEGRGQRAGDSLRPSPRIRISGLRPRPGPLRPWRSQSFLVAGRRP